MYNKEVVTVNEQSRTISVSNVDNCESDKTKVVSSSSPSGQRQDARKPRRETMKSKLSNAEEIRSR